MSARTSESFARPFVLGAAIALLAVGCSGGGDPAAPSNANRSVDSEQTVQQTMVEVPAGEFTAGSDEYKGDKDESKRKFTLKAYKIDKFETTNAMYKRFLDSITDPAEKKARTPRNDGAGMGGWSADGWYPMGEADFPVSNVTYDDAEAFAKWAGKRMPQRPEWERAARGTDERDWPWGNEWDGKKANVSPDVATARKKRSGAIPRARARSDAWTWRATSPSGLRRTSTRSTRRKADASCAAARSSRWTRPTRSRTAGSR